MIFELLIWRQGLVVQATFAADHIFEKYETSASDRISSDTLRSIPSEKQINHAYSSTKDDEISI